MSAMTDAAPIERRRPRPWRAIADSLLTHAMVAIGAVLVMIPFFFMVSTSLKHEWEAFLIPPQLIPSELVWSNYKRALFDYYNFAQLAGNTLSITLGVLVGRLLTAPLVAYGFARGRFFGRDVLFLVVLGTMMIPGQVTILPVYLMFNMLGWLNTYLPLVVPAWFGGGAFFIFLLRQFIMTVNPELDDAARIDGCGWFGIYWWITLPLIKPALAAMAIFSFLGTWNDFFGPLIFLRSSYLFTLQLGLQYYVSLGSPNVRPNITLVQAASTVIILPPLLVFFFFQRYFIQGIVISGVKG